MYIRARVQHRLGFGLTDEIHPLRVGAHGGLQISEGVLVDVAFANGGVEELLGDTTATTDGVVGEVLLDQGQTPFIGVAGRDITQRPIGPEELQKIASRVAIDQVGAGFGIAATSDVGVEEGFQPHELALRDESHSGQFVEQTFIETGQPPGGFVVGRMARHDRVAELFDAHLEGLGDPLVDLAEAQGATFTRGVKELNEPATILLSYNACHDNP